MIEPMVITVEGEKMSSMLLNDEGIYISSADAKAPEEWKSSFEKKLSLSTKKSILHHKIIWVKQELPGLQFQLRHEGTINQTAAFTIQNEAERAAFEQHLQAVAGLHYEEVQLSAKEALKPRLWALGIAAALGGLAMWLAHRIETGEMVINNDGSYRRGRWILNLLDGLGFAGTSLIAVGVVMAIGIFAYKRYQNPPVERRWVR